MFIHKQAQACGWRPEDNSAVVPGVLTTVFPTPLLVLCLYFGVRVFYWLGTHQMPDWLASDSQGSACLPVLCLLLCATIPRHPPLPIFWVGSGGSNLSPLSCKASTLLRGLSSNTILISELKPFTYLFMVLAIKTRAKWVWQSDMSMTTVQSKLKLLCIHKNGVKIHLITLLAFLIFIFIHLCICVYFCVCLQCVCRCPWRPGNVFGSPGARVRSPA